jgi:hypothetical protein
MSTTASRKTSLKALAVLTCLLTAFPTARLIGQQPADVELNDDSDWWSVTNEKGSSLEDKAQAGDLNLQTRDLSDSNFLILGMDIQKGALEQAAKELGDAAEMDRGDAATGRAQKCYISSDPKDKTYFIVEEGEVNKAFYLFTEAAPWTGMQYCWRSPKINRKLATASGLKLGLTPQEVIKVLEKPSFQSPDELQYFLEFNKKTSAEELAKLRKENPNLSEEEFMLDFGSYDLTIFIRIKFVHSKMEYLAISESETR